MGQLVSATSGILNISDKVQTGVTAAIAIGVIFLTVFIGMLIVLVLNYVTTLDIQSRLGGRLSAVS